MQSRRIFSASALLILATVFMAATAPAESCLWKISNGTGTLYLQGSVHVLRTDNYPLAPAIEKAYDESSILVLEVDMKEMESPATQQLILSKAMLPTGETLQKTLSPKVYSALTDAYARAGIPTEGMQQFKPWFCGITLAMVRMQELGFNPELGLDKYFHTKARADGKKVIGLETVRFQINLLDALAEGNQNDFMKRMLKDLELIENQVDELIDAWTNGNMKELGKLMLESFKEFPSFYEDFVVTRNRNWVGQFEKLLKNPETAMVVVGAGHLPDKGGLLEMLREKGYTLEQL